jgi:predicted MFS family arabinose efflux permease
MRLSGQGLMSHASTTTISRFFEKSRGKALSTVWFGLSTAEFILPVLVTYFFVIYSWRTVWQGIALLIILFLPFVILNTIKSINLDSREIDINPNLKKIKIQSWRRKDVIKDYRFYIVSLNMLAMPWMATGIFVYQSFIAESKMWDLYTIPKAFMVYSITSILTLFSSGYLVDKFTSRKLIPIMNIPLLLAMIVLFYNQHEMYAYVFLGLVGISNGFGNILGSSTWAEIYGVKYIGSIKALTTAFMVFATAFGTAVFGVLIDRGFTIENIAFICGTYIIISLILLVLFRKTLEPIKIVN